MYIEKKPTGWENRLASANARVMTIVYNIKQGCLATARFLRKHTTQINGKTEFASTGRSHQLLRIHFESDDAADPAGAGTYFLSSKNFEKKPIMLCVDDGAAHWIRPSPGALCWTEFRLRVCSSCHAGSLAVPVSGL